MSLSTKACIQSQLTDIVICVLKGWLKNLNVLTLTSLKTSLYFATTLCPSLVGSDLIHCNSRLDTGSNGVHSSAHPQKVDGLVLLTYCIFSMYSSNLHITFLDSL